MRNRLNRLLERPLMMVFAWTTRGAGAPKLEADDLAIIKNSARTLVVKDSAYIYIGLGRWLKIEVSK